MQGSSLKLQSQKRLSISHDRTGAVINVGSATSGVTSNSSGPQVILGANKNPIANASSKLAPNTTVKAVAVPARTQNQASKLAKKPAEAAMSANTKSNKPTIGATQLANCKQTATSKTAANQNSANAPIVNTTKSSQLRAGAKPAVAATNPAKTRYIILRNRSYISLKFIKTPINREKTCK